MLNDNNKQLIKNVKKPNIYYFILDAMMPLNEFNFYKEDLSDFKNFFNQKIINILKKLLIFIRIQQTFLHHYFT